MSTPTEAHRSLVRNFLHFNHWDSALEACAMRLIAYSEARAMQEMASRLQAAFHEPLIKERDQLRAELATEKEAHASQQRVAIEAHAELAKERARLDWAWDHAQDFTDMIDAIEWTCNREKNRVMRDSAMDAAMKEGAT